MKETERMEDRTYIDGKRDGEIREGEWQHVTTVHGPPLTRWQRLVAWLRVRLAR